MIKNLFIAAFICAFTFAFNQPTLAKSKSAARYPYLQNERLVPFALREIYDAQNTYQETVGNGNFGTFSQLISSGLLSNFCENSNFKKYGYGFQISKVNMTEEPFSPAKFYVTTFPLNYRRTGRKSFYIDYLGVMRASDKNGTIAVGDEPVVGNFPYTPLTVRSDRQAISALRLFHSAQITYQSTIGNGNFGLLEDLYGAGLINSNLRQGYFGGHFFQLYIMSPYPGVYPASFYVTATPYKYNSTGIRSFYINQTGVLRGADKNGRLATVNDPPVE